MHLLSEGQRSEVTAPFGVGLQSALIVSGHGGPAVVDVDVDVTELSPAVLRQSVGHIHDEYITVQCV